MKKKILSALCVLVALVLGGVVWWKLPVRFLARVEPEEVAYIAVFDGMTGQGFTIEDPEQIAHVVGNFQNNAVRKDSIDYRMGFQLRLTFVNKKDKEIESFILNGPRTIRKGLIFYECDDANLCSEYLFELEAAIQR